MSQYDIDALLTMLNNSNDKNVTMPMDMMVDIITKVRDIEVATKELPKVEELFSNDYWSANNSISAKTFLKQHDAGAISGDILISSCELAAVLKERTTTAKRHTELKDTVKALQAILDTYRRNNISVRVKEHLDVYGSASKHVKVKILTPTRY